MLMIFWLMSLKKVIKCSLINLLHVLIAKDDEWITPDTLLDFLGMDISIDDDNIYMSMQTYVEKMLHARGMSRI